MQTFCPFPFACDCFQVSLGSSISVLFCPQRPVFGLLPGPGRVCCCPAGFVALHREPGGIPAPARGDEARSGVAAPSGVRLLVSLQECHLLLAAQNGKRQSALKEGDPDVAEGQVFLGYAEMWP